MDWTVAKIIEATGGRLLKGCPDSHVRSISTDTRLIDPGSCFVALTGENHDGHLFLDKALERQAAALIVAERRPEVQLPSAGEAAVVEVPDTLYALGELARYFRRQVSIPVVGITGSNGKTSTKEMVAGILSIRHRVLKNQGNFNNLIGVPLTLLSLLPEHQAAVVEMGINVPGEMARLVEITCPTVGLITNIHPAHLEGLGSLEGIVHEKTFLWKGLEASHPAVVNLDDERLVEASRILKGPLVTYSLNNPSAHVRLTGAVKVQEDASVFPLVLGGEKREVRLSVLGLHQVQNAVAAAAVAWAMGEASDTIVEGLSRHLPVKQRMQVHHLPDGGMLIDDSYNANPGSTYAAVQAARTSSGGNPLCVILGEMRELGAASAALHHELGFKIGELGVSYLATLGAMGAEIVRGAKEAGMSDTECRSFGTHEEILSWLRANCPAKAWILVKGSRAMAMERVVEGILKP